jgi:hypothetical protein
MLLSTSDSSYDVGTDLARSLRISNPKKLLHLLFIILITSDDIHVDESRKVRYVKLRPLPQPQLRARTHAETNPSAQGATKLRSVLARVCSVSRQNLNTNTVP